MDLRPKFPDPTSPTNSLIDVIPEAEYSTVGSDQHAETFHTVSLEYPVVIILLCPRIMIL